MDSPLGRNNGKTGFSSLSLLESYRVHTSHAVTDMPVLIPPNPP